MKIQNFHVDTPHGLTSRQLARALGYAVVFGGFVVGRRTDLDQYLTPEQRAGISTNPQPSTLHQLKACEICQCDLWIGPQQLIIVKVQDLPMVCVLCQVVMNLLKDQLLHERQTATATGNAPEGGEVRMVILNADEDMVPRRT